MAYPDMKEIAVRAKKQCRMRKPDLATPLSDIMEFSETRSLKVNSDNSRMNCSKDKSAFTKEDINFFPQTVNGLPKEELTFSDTCNQKQETGAVRKSRKLLNLKSCARVSQLIDEKQSNDFPHPFLHGGHQQVCHIKTIDTNLFFGGNRENANLDRKECISLHKPKRQDKRNSSDLKMQRIYGKMPPLKEDYNLLDSNREGITASIHQNFLDLNHTQLPNIYSEPQMDYYDTMIWLSGWPEDGMFTTRSGPLQKMYPNRPQLNSTRQKRDNEDAATDFVSPSKSNRGLLFPGATRNFTVARSSLGAPKKAKPVSDEMSSIPYYLSDPMYITMGWTQTPFEEDFSPIFIFKAVPANSATYWSRIRQNVQVHKYNDGRLAAVYNLDGTGYVLYPNGEKAITMIKNRKTEEIKLTVNTLSGKDSTGVYQKSTNAAIFDTFGNGIVFDRNKETRLNYDQAGGVLYETRSEVPLKWRWKQYAAVIQRRNQLKEVPEENFIQPEKKGKGSSSHVSVKKKTSGTSVPSRGSPRSRSSHNSRTLHRSRSSQRSFKGQYSNTVFPILPRMKPLPSNLGPYLQFNPILIKITPNVALRIISQENITLDYLASGFTLRLSLGVNVKPEVLERFAKLRRKTTFIRGLPCALQLVHGSNDVYRKEIPKDSESHKKPQHQKGRSGSSTASLK